MESTILVVGDVMLDRYISGDCNRISPEAPVPILKANVETSRLGGAANVALNIKNLGIKTTLFGCIGADEHGRTIQNILSENDIQDQCIPCHTTTVKTRLIAKSQQLMRIDNESQFIPGKDFIAKLASTLESVQPSIILISDYGKGVVDEHVMNTIKNYSQQHSIKILVDPKSSNWLKYEGAYLIKPNLKELEEVVGQHVTIENMNELLRNLQNDCAIENVLVTRSSDGMVLCNDTEVVHFSTQEVEVYDVTGAGDTALAVLAYGICTGMKLTDAIRLATKASSYVVTKNKTYAISKKELENL